MKTATHPALSSLVRDQINRPSPIRQIMKMAEKQNILAMGLDPAQVISFGGGWVNHSAPDEFRLAYESVVADAELFHKSGGYTATLGDMECREQIARFEEELFGVPRLGPQHIAIGMGSTQLTHDLFRTLLDPGDTVMLLDPTYANYEGQLAFSVPGVKIVRLRVLEPETWSYLPETDPAGTAKEFSRLFDLHRPRMVLFGAPDNPTSQVLPQALADVMLAKTVEAGSWLVIDAAYKCQYFHTPPAYYAWSPADHPNVVGIHSNSKWARGLGRRLGWIEAQESVVEAIERVQQCSILCPDTLSQMAMTRYLKSAIPSGSLKRYVAEANALYKKAADVTLQAVDTHLQRPRLTPFGGLYTCVDIGTNAEDFVPRALKATGVLVVPGGGFGESLRNGVRISFGPLVKDTPKIEEGISRLGTWMKTAKLRAVSVLLGLTLAATSAAAQTMTPAAGVPLEIATRRAAIVSGLHYDLSLSIPEALASPVTGSTTIRFDLKDASAPLVLDFETSRGHVKTIDANGRPAEINYVNGHVVIPAASLVAGANTIRIGFDAGNASLNRSSDFLYTLFVPARARLAFPVFDQPDLKGRWTVTLEHPAKWQSAANGAELSRTPSVSSAPSAADRVTVTFARTEPLPTYLVAFIAGDFKIETAERNGRTFRMFHRETDAAKVARNRDAVFELHARALEFLERYTAIAYPFGKFDFVAIPAFQFGGMEHAGKILYNASGLMLDESATQNQLLGRASVIAHETAHMWFGDLVTMRWFNDVWMKEVFANFMAAKIVNPSFPTVHHELRFLLSNYPSAYEVDRTSGANPIRQVLENLDEAGSMYGAIIYQKAPVVMRHLEALLGADNFRDGLREYLKGHAFANATWSDLITVLDARTPSDLQQWSRAWVEQPGRPTVETILEVKNGSISRLAFRQKDPWNRNRLWPQQLRVAIGGHAPQQVITVELVGGEVEVPQATGLPAPRYVLPNGAGWAYGDFVLDKTTLAYLTSNLPDISDPLTRGSAWVTLWDALLDHRVAPEAFFNLAMRSLPRESDEQMTSRILGYASNTWWRYLDQPARTPRAARFESLLREGLTAAGTPSQKAAWFGALRNVALTPPTVGWLRQVWEKKESVAGLPLAEADYTALALELAVRQVDGWSEIVKTQLSRIENPDRRGRFQFVVPALSADPLEREQWFLSLRDVNNRRREPWVLEGLSYLHHPLRADASKKYVQPALDMLWDIQKTGDIFFPKRWLDATLGGHQTKDVADTVRDFLKNLPANYPERLRNITLQSADELNRAAGIVKH